MSLLGDALKTIAVIWNFHQKENIFQLGRCESCFRHR